MTTYVHGEFSTFPHIKGPINHFLEERVSAILEWLHLKNNGSLNLQKPKSKFVHITHYSLLTLPDFNKNHE